MKETSDIKKPTLFYIISIISSVLLMVLSIFLLILFVDEEKTGKAFLIEQSVVIVIAISSACNSIVTNRKNTYNNDVHRNEQQKREDKIRVELFEREDSAHKRQEKFESRWNQIKIDADLIAKARIDWIESVRKEVATLIGLYHSILSCYDDYNNLKLYRLKMIEQTQLVILYFGNDSDNSNSTNLLNSTSNMGKNNQIVNLISGIEERMSTYCHQTTEEKYKKIKAEYDALLNEYENHITGVDYDEEIIIDGEIFHDTQYTVDTKYETILNEKKSQMDEIIKYNLGIRKDIDILSNAIRIYLKIEWNIAKTGK